MAELSEDEKLAAWRVDTCNRLGVPEVVKNAVLMLELDAHEFADLVEAGCDPEVAVEILRP